MYLFIRASANLEAYNMPQLLLQEAERTWRRTKREESRHSLTDFEMDVKRILSTMLEIKPVDTKVCFEDCELKVVAVHKRLMRFNDLHDVGNHK